MPLQWLLPAATALALHGVPRAAGTVLATTPVQQVLTMLEEMKTKGEKAVRQERMMFDTYTKLAKDRKTELSQEIAAAKTEIEELAGTVAKATNAAENIDAAIAEIDAQVKELEDAQGSATAQRDTEKAEYTELAQDYAESIDALERAIMTLKSQNYDRPQALMLLQRMARGSAAGRQVLAAVELARASERQPDEAMGAPSVAAYEFQSGSIIDLLQGILKKFRTELAEAQTEEGNKAHAYELELLHLGHTVEQLKADREEQAALAAARKSTAAEAAGHLAATKADLAKDEKLLADTEADLRAQQATFDNNQKIRADEIAALTKAIEIISDPAVAESYSTHVKAPAFFQRSLLSANARKARALALLRTRAASLASETLTTAAGAVARGPFDKVIEMIRALIAKLSEEASAEASHKAWCDEELRKNKLKRETYTSRVEKARAELDVRAGQIQQMADEIAALASEQAALTKAMAEATTARSAEKESNLAQIKDAAEAQAAVKQALVVLREFYVKQEALIQRRQAPKIEAYEGMKGSSGGVIGLLEVIESDFARVEADTRAGEATAAREYNRFMEDSKVTIKEKHDREFQLSLDKDQAEFEKSQLADDLADNEKELKLAQDYFGSLQPQCVEIHVSFEERAAKRQEEIAALKEAYKILEGISLGGAE